MKQRVLILLLCLLFSGSVGAQNIEKEVRYLERAYELRSTEMVKKFAKRWQRRVRPNNHRAKNEAEKAIYDIYYVLYDKAVLGLDTSYVEKWYVPAPEVTYYLLLDTTCNTSTIGDTAEAEENQVFIIPEFHPKLRYPLEKTFYVSEAYQKIMLAFADRYKSDYFEPFKFVGDYIPFVQGHFGDPEMCYNVAPWHCNISLDHTLDSAIASVDTDRGEVYRFELRKQNNQWHITDALINGYWDQ